MGEVVDLPRGTMRRRAPHAATQPTDIGGAQILFFTGVRYERDPDVLASYVPAHTPSTAQRPDSQAPRLQA